MGLSNLSVPRGIDITVITATLPDKNRPPEGLANAYDSIASQGGDFFWQWIIQVDGGEPEYKMVKKLLGDRASDPRVDIRQNSRRLGQALTRNLALKSARGGAVVALDDDDKLNENAFETWLTPFSDNPDIGWTAGQFVDDLGDEFIQGRTVLPEGLIEKGQLFYHWDSPERLFPLPPFCFAFKTDLLRKIGGWQGLPQGEDFGAAMAASFLATGFVSGEIVYLYTRHPGQMRFREDFSVLESSVRNIIWDRAVALRADLEPGSRFG